jgi:hypothetical protein
MLATQRPMPLPTYVRWAIDRGSPDDPQQRSWLVLFFDGHASWRIVDRAGRDLFRVPIPGSGIFGLDSCSAKERRPDENTGWRALDRATLEAFVRDHRTTRAIAEGIPSGEVPLELVDTGCRPFTDHAGYFDRTPRHPGYQWTRNGVLVSSRELGTSAGPEHCAWQSATFLTIGWPLGTISESARQSRQYIRDPRGVLHGSFKERFAGSATLPRDARATGYRYGPFELFLSPSDQDQFVYVVGPSAVERWPRSDPMTLCV